MWAHVILFLVILGNIKYVPSSSSLDCATRVRKCPTKKDQWRQKGYDRNCSSDEGYVCLRNSSGYLFETCMRNFTIKADSGNCPILHSCIDNRPYLGPVSGYNDCPEKVPGCPPEKHKQYSIYRLYEYPRCIESNTSEEEPETSSPRPTIYLILTTKESEIQNKNDSSHSIIFGAAALITFFGSGGVVACIIYVKRKCQDSKTKRVKNLRGIILSCNELEADKVRILSSNAVDMVTIDSIYVPVLFSDESKKPSNQIYDCTESSNTTLDKIFKTIKGNPARFIFMLGEAGSGKTAQCQRIAKSWCKSWQNQDTISEDLEKSLKQYDFLFVVKMCDTEKTSLMDMIKDAYSDSLLTDDDKDLIRSILRDKKYKCLILLDGLEEWNVPEDRKKYITIDSKLPECSILITMRSWKFMDVKCLRSHRFDNVVRLQGFDEDGVLTFTENVLNYLKEEIPESENENIQERCKRVRNKISTAAAEVKSLMRIPLFAIFCILIWYQNLDTGDSKTSFYLSIIEALMKRYYQKYPHKHLPEEATDDHGILKHFDRVKANKCNISLAGKVALGGLTSKNKSSIFPVGKLHEMISEEKLHEFLEVGLLSQVPVFGDLIKDKVKISFLHKTFQEVLAAFYLSQEGQDNTKIEDFLTNSVPGINNVLEFSTTLIVLSGLSPKLGCRISKRIAELASEDEDIKKFRYYFSSQTYGKICQLYDLQLRCYREIRGKQSIERFCKGQLRFSLSDIILHGKETDKLVIRETAEILICHVNDIESLQMKFIPNDEQIGITNDEINNFLDKSTSIKSVNIDGYVDGKCREFKHFSKRMASLRTLGLHHIAVDYNMIEDLFTGNNEYQALGLFYIRTPDDPEFSHKVSFSAGKNTPLHRPGYEKKQSTVSFPESNSSGKIKDNGRPMLTKSLNAFSGFEHLTTFHVSYMESYDDRQSLLQVLPNIKKLDNFGYQGASIFSDPDDEYDSKVIEIIMKRGQLKKIFLCEIIWENDEMNFNEITNLEVIDLQDVELNINQWRIFVKAVSDYLKTKEFQRRVDSKTKEPMEVVLTDTNINRENRKQLECIPGLLTRVIGDCSVR